MQLSFDALSTPSIKLEPHGQTVTDLLGQPHNIKSESTRLGKECESKARHVLELLGFRCTDAGEGYEYDLLTHSHAGVQRIQVKALSLGGANRLGRSSQKTSGSVSKSYGSDAFDFLMLINRDGYDYYLIPSAALVVGGVLKSSVTHSKFSAFHFH